MEQVVPFLQCMPHNFLVPCKLIFNGCDACILTESQFGSRLVSTGRPPLPPPRDARCACCDGACASERSSRARMRVRLCVSVCVRVVFCPAGGKDDPCRVGIVFRFRLGGRLPCASPPVTPTMRHVPSPLGGGFPSTTRRIGVLMALAG